LTSAAMKGRSTKPSLALLPARAHDRGGRLVSPGDHAPAEGFRVQDPEASQDCEELSIAG